MEYKEEINSLVTLSGKIDPSLQKALIIAQSQTINLSVTASKAASDMADSGKKVKSSFFDKINKAGIGKVVGMIGELGIKGINLAADLAGVQKVVDNTFGAGSGQIDKWADSALEAFGLSETQAKRYTASLGTVMKNSGITGGSLATMSEKLAGLAGDYASFYNVTQDDAFEKIRAGIGGDAGALEEFNINMSDANLQAFALSKGIETSYQSMDQASQTALRYSYLMEASKDAQGDFAKTLDTSYASQKKLFDNRLQDMLTQVAYKTLPVVAEGIGIVNSLLGKIDVGALGDVIAQGAESVLEMVSQLAPVILEVVSMAMPLLQGLIPPIVQLAEGILPVLIQLIQIILVAIEPLIPLILSLVQQLLPPVQQILDAIMTVLIALMPLIQILAQVLAVDLGASIQMMLPWIMLMVNDFQNLMNILAEVINFIVNIFTGNWSGAWQNIVNIFTGIWDLVVDHIKGVINAVIGSINGAIGGINKISGMISKVTGINLYIPTIPAFARGGFANRPSIFGEAGLEAAIPIRYKNPRSLSLLNTAARAIGAEQQGLKQGVSMNFNFYGPVSNKADVTDGVNMARDYIIQVMEEFFEDKERISYA